MITKNQKNFLKKDLIQHNSDYFETTQTSFFVDLQQTSPKKNDKTEIDSLENKVETNEMKPKKSIFSKIFGLSNKTNVKNSFQKSQV